MHRGRAHLRLKARKRTTSSVVKNLGSRDMLLCRPNWKLSQRFGLHAVLNSEPLPSAGTPRSKTRTQRKRLQSR